jgi:antibiotic biosynthesis monooxygenase (ABM) superfamily enzyme
MQLKPQFGFNYTAFGGVEGFNRWFDTVAHPSCPPEVIVIMLLCFCIFY